jgi:hypothetical protein
MIWREVPIIRLFLFLAFTSTVAAAADRTYTLETLEVRGTERIEAEVVSAECGLKPGVQLSDAKLVESRQCILGLGLFNNAVLLMRKGKSQGLIHLVVELSDDPNVLTNWALGGELAVTLAEKDFANVVGNSDPTGYRLGLVSRNLFTIQHRGAISAEIDSEGNFHRGQIAYGLPRFGPEGTQFDAELSVVDVKTHYLDTQGFGTRAQALWSQTITHGLWHYGVGVVTNNQDRFKVPVYPNLVAGPKFGFIRETRLLGFIPGPGYQLAAAVLLDPRRTKNSVSEASASQTFALWDILYATLRLRGQAIGVEGGSGRVEARLDVPLGQHTPGEDQAIVFFGLRHGVDHYKEADLVGSDGILGVRYHSSGFIAELALKITRSPREFRDSLETGSPP